MDAGPVGISGKNAGFARLSARVGHELGQAWLLPGPLEPCYGSTMGRRTLAALGAVLAAACTTDCPAPGYAPHTYDETLDEWAGPAKADGARPNCNTVEVGQCADGKQFLAQLTIFTAEVRYFDDQHQFLGGAEQGDVIRDDGCTPGTYGPSREAVRCQVAQHAPLCGDESNTNFALPLAD